MKCRLVKTPKEASVELIILDGVTTKLLAVSTVLNGASKSTY